ncbi:NAD(P)H-quinone oxidoreductase subunit T, chloroplastic [Cocos nucifera]|uniref:NAD(P)H-quinone oxidoreductase subunit T, chloroplastic n=1 Tax=Cocos nucifera TaxID=13894 RepID=A0A8K0IYQ0_COCNU|nr:NAD(P)H-quinone oxidoreductase subunit T, chloroplastic [Cocos nucifera]
MATAASPSLSPIIVRGRKYKNPVLWRMHVRASDSSGGSSSAGEKRKRRVDTRIHWSNPDEGWIGGGKTTPKTENEKKEEILGGRFLGVSAKADMEEIKAAYRRLSKEYHPDTTSLPLKAAAEKFIELREAYNVLSDEDNRRFYDWTLTQEAKSRRAERMRMKLEDPYEQDLRDYESVPDMVDRLGGKNMKLSDQAMTAITIDAAIILFSICCLIYVVFFKEQY